MQNDEILRDLHVTDLTVSGDGVARAGGRVVFIEGALPGAVVHARVTGTRKGTARAVLHETVAPSPHAVSPWCPHCDECGACLWQHFSLSGARDWKTRHVRETLARIGNVKDISVTPTLASPLEKGFRNKMSFAFGGEEELLLGLRRRGGKGVVEVTRCGLQGEPTMRLLGRARTLAREAGLAAWRERRERKGGSGGYLRFLVVRVPEYRPDGAARVVVECITGPDHDAAPRTAECGATNREAVRFLGRELVREFGLSGFVHSERASREDVAQGERTVWSTGQSHIVERFGAIEVMAPHGAFLQTNTGAASLLYEQAAIEAQLNGAQCVWDLYSGVGAIALYMAGRVREVHGFEKDPRSVEAAKNNSKTLGFDHCFFHQGTVTAERLAALPEPDVILVDPPRAGIEPHIVDTLDATYAKRIIYISCDIATQARDIKMFSDAWKPVKSIPVDMFPYTPHVENIVVLNRITE